MDAKSKNIIKEHGVYINMGLGMGFIMGRMQNLPIGILIIIHDPWQLHTNLLIRNLQMQGHQYVTK
jgi:hypothetical protein